MIQKIFNTISLKYSIKYELSSNWYKLSYILPIFRNYTMVETRKTWSGSSRKSLWVRRICGKILQDIKLDLLFGAYFFKLQTLLLLFLELLILILEMTDELINILKLSYHYFPLFLKISILNHQLLPDFDLFFVFMLENIIQLKFLLIQVKLLIQFF